MIMLSMEWYEYVLRPEIIWAVIALAGVIAYTATTIVRMHHRHRERIEMIKRGMRPDNAGGEVTGRERST